MGSSDDRQQLERLERGAAEWCTLVLFAALVLGNGACVLAGSLARRRAPLCDHPVYTMWRGAAYGTALGGLYALVAAGLPYDGAGGAWPVVRAVECLLWAAYLPSYGALVWQLVWRDMTNEFIVLHTRAMHSATVSRRVAGRMRVSYALSRTWVAEAFACVTGAAQACVCAALGLLAGPARPSVWPNVVAAVVWLCAGAGAIVLLYVGVRAEALVVSRRAVIRTVAVWAVVAGVCGLLAVERVDGALVRAAALGGILASTGSSMWVLYADALLAGVRERRRRARSTWTARGRGARAGGGGAPSRRNLWAREPEHPGMVTARAWVRMVYADDRVYAAWMAYVSVHARACAVHAAALRTIGLTEAGVHTEQQCLTALRLTHAAPDALLESLWMTVSDRLRTNAAPMPCVFTMEHGRALVLYLLRAVQPYMRAFVDTSDELRAVAVGELQQRLAHTLARGGPSVHPHDDDDGDDDDGGGGGEGEGEGEGEGGAECAAGGATGGTHLPPAGATTDGLGAYPSALMADDEEEMHDVLLYGDELQFEQDEARNGGGGADSGGDGVACDGVVTGAPVESAW